MNYLALFWLLFLIGVIAPVSAQDAAAEDEPHPLLQMLALVPDTANSRVDILSYVDYRAVEYARRTVISPANYAIFRILPSESTQRWLQATQRIQSGPSILQYFTQYGDMPAVVGFDFFDIDQALAFGHPPSQGMILAGEFDAESIGAAHAGRGYIADEIEGYTVWCHPEGCDMGMQQDLRNRNPANIFDPTLGRKPPVLILPGYLASSPNLEVVQGVAESAATGAVTLADAPGYRALAQAITDPERFSGDLVQVNFLNNDPSYTLDLTIFETREAFDENARSLLRIAALPDEWLAYDDLPRYFLAALADRQEGETQVALVALVYLNPDDAQAAAEEMADRIGAFQGVLILRDNTEPLMNRAAGAVVDEPYVYISEDTGVYVAIASISYPLPTVEGRAISEEPVEGQAPPGLIYRFWIQSIFQRAFYPMWQIALPEWAKEE